MTHLKESIAIDKLYKYIPPTTKRTVENVVNEYKACLIPAKEAFEEIRYIKEMDLQVY